MIYSSDYTLSPSEAHGLLRSLYAMKISEIGVRKLVERKKVKAEKRGGRVYISASSLSRYARSRRVS